MAENKMTQQEAAISLLSFDPVIVLRDVLRRWYLIVAAALIVGMGAYTVTELCYVPQYTTTTTFVVTMQESSSSVYQNLSATSTLATTFSEIINSSILRKTVMEELGTDSFGGTIEASAVEETNLLTMKVTDSNPRTAFLATKAIIEHHSEVSRQILGNTVLEVLQNPTVPTAPSNPLRAGSNGKKAAAIAAAAMCVLLGVLSFMRDAVRSSEEAVNKLDCRVLAEIDHERKYRTLWAALRRRKTSILITNPLTSFSFTEKIRTLRRKLEQHMPENGKIVMVSSVLENEGKSTVAANLALSLAQKHKRVLLMDCDMRKPACGKILGMSGTYGTIDVLKGAAELSEAVTEYPENKSLHLLLESRSVRNSTKLVSSDAMAALIQAARGAYDYIILDTPPMSAGSDAEVLSDLADGTLLVIRQNQANAGALRGALEVLQETRAKVLGCVLNDCRSSPITDQSSYGYGYGTYGHYGHYGKYGKYGKYGAYGAARKESR